MLDLLLGWAVIIFPTLFAIGLELINEDIRKRRNWRWGVLLFGLCLSALTWWQQVRAVRQAATDRQEAIGHTADRIAKQTTENVTDAMGKQYGGLITSLTKQIGDLQGQLAEQGKKVAAIGQSNIVTGKKPVAVVVTNPAAAGLGGELPLAIQVATLPATPNPQYGKNARQFIPTTNKVMNGGRVVVTCSAGKINQGSAQIAGVGGMMSSGGGIQDDHTYVSGISLPNWAPNFPLLITLYFDSDSLGMCQFKPL